MKEVTVTQLRDDTAGIVAAVKAGSPIAVFSETGLQCLLLSPGEYAVRDVIRIFGPEAGVRWLTTPNPAFGGRVPEDMVEHQGGLLEVEQLLTRLTQRLRQRVMVEGFEEVMKGPPGVSIQEALDEILGDR